MTDDERAEAIRRFFAERLVPAAVALGERGVEFFPQAPDAGLATYYAARRAGEAYVFLLPAAEHAASLRTMWSAHPELVGLVEPLLALAAQLAVRGDESHDVSPFIYAMF